MTRQIDVSVIIVSYNTKTLTEDTIKSVLKEGSDLKKEIIVVDNNSLDGSLEMLRKYKKLGKIILIENKDNLGFARANNQAMRVATGRHMFLLNSDTVVKRYAIRNLIEFAERTPDAGVVGARLLNADGTIQGSCGYFPTIINAIRQYWFGQKGLFEKYAPKTDKPVVVDSIVGAAFLITDRALDEVGMLNEKYFFYFEDIDYCRSVKRAGLKVYYFPKSQIIHFHGASGKKIADEANQWRRLIPSSKIYHGLFKHYLITFVLWSGQKWQKYFGTKN